MEYSPEIEAMLEGEEIPEDPTALDDYYMRKQAVFMDETALYRDRVIAAAMLFKINSRFVDQFLAVNGHYQTLLQRLIETGTIESMDEPVETRH